MDINDLMLLVVIGGAVGLLTGAVMMSMISIIGGLFFKIQDGKCPE